MLDLKQEVGTVADIDRRRHRPIRGLPDEARGAGNAKLHHHIAVRLVGLGPCSDVEIVGIGLVSAAQRQQRTVGFTDNAPDIFLEHPRQIAALADGILIGALMLAAGQQINAAPHDGDDRDAQIGRGLPKCTQPLCHSGARRCRAVHIHCDGYLLLCGCVGRAETPVTDGKVRIRAGNLEVRLPGRAGPAAGRAVCLTVPWRHRPERPGRIRRYRSLWSGHRAHATLEFIFY